MIGAGVAGPVAAIALRRAGIDAEVFEAHPSGTDEVGSWLALQANGIDTLRAVDTHRLVAGIGYPTRTLRFVDGRGTVLGRTANGPVLSDGAGSQVHRCADLYQALRDEARARGASVVHGKRLMDARTAGARSSRRSPTRRAPSSPRPASWRR